jgi:hypothetical protein
MAFAIVQGEMGDSDEGARTTACVISGRIAYAKCFGSFLSLKTYILNGILYIFRRPTLPHDLSSR